MKELIKEALGSFEFMVDNTIFVEEILKDLGYVERSGYFGCKRKYFIVRPFRKWYYPAEFKTPGKIHLTIEEIQPDAICSLVVHKN
jgi:hypothetical protein